jgi:hypothetical protein
VSQSITGRNDDPLTEISFAVNDVEMDPITICLLSLPARGRLYYDSPQPENLITTPGTCLPSALFIYLADPAPSACGTYTEVGSPYAAFDWKGRDPGGLDTGALSMTVNVEYRNLPPTNTTPASVSCVQDTSASIALTGNDPDEGPSNLNTTILTVPQHGGLSVLGYTLTPADVPIQLPPGFTEVVYAPEPGFSNANGPPDRFDFQLADNSGGACDYSVDLVVSPAARKK